MSDLDPSTASVAVVSDHPNSGLAPTKKPTTEKPPLSAYQAGKAAKRRPRPQR